MRLYYRLDLPKSLQNYIIFVSKRKNKKRPVQALPYSFVQFTCLSKHKLNKNKSTNNLKSFLTILYRVTNYRTDTFNINSWTTGV